MADSCQTVYWCLYRHHPLPFPYVTIFILQGKLPSLVTLNLYLFLTALACRMLRKKLPYKFSSHSLAGKNCTKPASKIYYSFETQKQNPKYILYILIFFFIWTKLDIQVSKQWYLFLPNPDISESFLIIFSFFSLFYAKKKKKMYIHSLCFLDLISFWPLSIQVL